MTRIRTSNSEYRNAILTSAHIRVTNRALNESQAFMPLLGFSRAMPLANFPDFRELMEEL